MFVKDDPNALETPKVVIGLMSGTSVDAVDACCVRLSMKDGVLRHEILGNYTHPMPANTRKRLLACMDNKPVMLRELSSLNTAVAQVFVDAAYGVMGTSGLPRDKIDLIGSHGQTVFHQPPRGEGVIGNTLQIGEPSVIAEYTGVPVAADFRPKDMALGGQGAPLVPYADQLLFQHETLGRCIQNIGGMANVTVLPPKTEAGKDVIAFDTGPGNVLIDAAMEALFGKTLDDGGKMAASGKIDTALLETLMQHEFLQETPPKSTGRETFSKTMALEIIENNKALAKEDIIATLTAYTAESIADAYRRFVLPHTRVDEVIVGGGGVFNQTLMKKLRDKLSAFPTPVTLKTHAEFGIPDKYKEALAFAILGWSAMAGLPNNIPSCTGARQAAVLGKLVL